MTFRVRLMFPIINGKLQPTKVISVECEGGIEDALHEATRFIPELVAFAGVKPAPFRICTVGQPASATPERAYWNMNGVSLTIMEI